MAWTAADVTAIEDAIRAKVTGGAVRSMGYGGRSITHMSVAELQALKADMLREIAEVAGTDVSLVDFRDIRQGVS